VPRTCLGAMTGDNERRRFTSVTAGTLRSLRATRPLAREPPLQVYADYPFMLCVNDQFDRFSWPRERRFTEREFRAMMCSADLEEVVITPRNGWVASGKCGQGLR
jgi:hypothetical protein